MSKAEFITKMYMCTIGLGLVTITAIQLVYYFADYVTSHWVGL